MVSPLGKDPGKAVKRPLKNFQGIFLVDRDCPNIWTLKSLSAVLTGEEDSPGKLGNSTGKEVATTAKTPRLGQLVQLRFRAPRQGKYDLTLYIVSGIPPSSFDPPMRLYSLGPDLITPRDVIDSL
jgi:hypothetical protein